MPPGKADEVAVEVEVDVDSARVVDRPADSVREHTVVAAGAAGFIMVFKVGFGKIFGVFSPKRRKAMAAAKAAAAETEES